MTPDGRRGEGNEPGGRLGLRKGSVGDMEGPGSCLQLARMGTVVYTRPSPPPMTRLTRRTVHRCDLKSVGSRVPPPHERGRGEEHGWATVEQEQ